MMKCPSCGTAASIVALVAMSMFGKVNSEMALERASDKIMNTDRQGAKATDVEDKGLVKLKSKIRLHWVLVLR